MPEHHLKPEPRHVPKLSVLVNDEAVWWCRILFDSLVYDSGRAQTAVDHKMINDKLSKSFTRHI